LVLGGGKTRKKAQKKRYRILTMTAPLPLKKGESLIGGSLWAGKVVPKGYKAMFLTKKEKVHQSSVKGESGVCRKTATKNKLGSLTGQRKGNRTRPRPWEGNESASR